MKSKKEFYEHTLKRIVRARGRRGVMGLKVGGSHGEVKWSSPLMCK